jgi:hypothetical protein
MEIKIIDLKTSRGQWLGISGLRKLGGRPPKKIWTINVNRNIGGHPVTVEGRGLSLDTALDDAIERLDSLEKDLEKKA